VEKYCQDKNWNVNGKITPQRNIKEYTANWTNWYHQHSLTCVSVQEREDQLNGWYLHLLLHLACYHYTQNVLLWSHAYLIINTSSLYDVIRHTCDWHLSGRAMPVDRPRFCSELHELSISRHSASLPCTERILSPTTNIKRGRGW
jgi:hypothetical protein